MSTMMLTAKKCAPEDIADLWDQFKKDPSRKELRNALIENYLPLVKYNGERIWQRLPDGVELDDLISAGVFGLMDAINAFDMGRGVKFETYCVPRIRGAMLDELRSMDWVPRLVRSKQSKFEAARKALEVVLGRPPMPEEIAERLRSLEERNRQLEAQIKDMNAKKTPRGLVVTIGDVLFDTDKAELKSGSMRNLEKLVSFLKENPQRKAVVEGFTDSTGSDSHNQELSGRRASAVRTALIDMGVGGERVDAHGYGEAYPVASNGNAGGRQMNRRVEIVLSEENGTVPPR